MVRLDTTKGADNMLGIDYEQMKDLEDDARLEDAAKVSLSREKTKQINDSLALLQLLLFEQELEHPTSAKWEQVMIQYAYLIDAVNEAKAEGK